MRRPFTTYGTQLALAALAVSTLLLAAPATQAFDRDDDDDEGDARVWAIGPGQSYAFSGVSDRAYLGVQLEEETEWAEGGARITRVVDDSPADRAGLRKGDIIVGFGDRTIRGPVALTQAIHDTEPGDAVSLTIVRDGREQRIEAEMGEREGLRVLSPQWNEEFAERMGALGERLGYAFSCEEGDCTMVAPDCEGSDCGQGLNWGYFGNLGRPTLGVQLVEVTPELREHLGSDDGVGVLVSKVLRGTPAESAGVRVGDLIVSVGGEAIGNTSDLRRALHDKRGETFDVEVLRDRRSVRIEVTIPEPERDRPTGPRASIEGYRDRHRGTVVEARAAYRAALDQARAARRSGVSAGHAAARAYREAYREALRDSSRAGRVDIDGSI